MANDPLHSAVRSFDEELEGDLNPVNMFETSGNTPLHSAVRSYDGDLYPIKMLLKQNAIDINKINSKGETPLHLAAQNETCFSEELIQFLLDNGADVNLVNTNDETALHLIAQNTAPILRQFTKPILSTDSLSLMLKEKAEHVEDKAAPVKIPLSESVDSDLRSGKRPIVQRTIPESVKILLERGLDVNTTNLVGSNSLHLATENKIWCFHLVRIFLKKDPKINARNLSSETPLHWVVRSEVCPVSLVKLLLDNGAGVKIHDKLNMNAYQAYCMNVIVKDPMLEILLRSEEQQHMKSSLHVASLCHNIEFVTKLLSKGADVNDVDTFDYPPLFYALIVYTDTTEKIANKTEVVKLLLHHGADINHIFPRFNVPTRHLFDYYMSLESLGFVGLNEGNPEEDKVMLDILHNHKAKLFTLHERRVQMGIFNAPMFSEFKVPVCDGPVEGQSEQQNLFLNRCNEELTAMGETKVGESEVTFLDLLLADDEKTEGYAKNEKLMEAFRAEKDRFPLYEGMLETKLAKGLKQRDEPGDRLASLLLQLLQRDELRNMSD